MNTEVGFHYKSVNHVNYTTKSFLHDSNHAVGIVILIVLIRDIEAPVPPL